MKNIAIGCTAKLTTLVIRETKGVDVSRYVRQCTRLRMTVEGDIWIYLYRSIAAVISCVHNAWLPPSLPVAWFSLCCHPSVSTTSSPKRPVCCISPSPPWVITTPWASCVTHWRRYVDSYNCTIRIESTGFKMDSISLMGLQARGGAPPFLREFKENSSYSWRMTEKPVSR